MVTQSIGVESAAGHASASESLEALRLPGAGRDLRPEATFGEVSIEGPGIAERGSFSLERISDLVQKLVIDAPSATSRFVTSLGVAACHVLRRPGVALAAAGLSAGAFAPAAKGGLELDGSSDSTYLSLGAQATHDQGGLLLGLKVLVPGVGTGERDTSATWLNSEYAITAAHNVADLMQYNPTFQITTGDNYMTSPGTVIPVASVSIYPGYVYNVTGPFNSPDIAIIHFAEPVPGAAATIASASVGETVYGAGFGHYGTPLTGLFPQDGNARGWSAPVLPFTPPDVSPTYYVSTDFEDGILSVPNGQAESGDSGGPWYDAKGDLLGITIAGATGLPTSGDTDYLNLTQPDVESWVSQNTVATPEPSTFSIFIIAAAGVLFRRRRQQVG